MCIFRLRIGKKTLMNISELVSQSLTYVITWSESSKAPAYYCAWRIDPCLVIISSPDIQYKLYVQIGKKLGAIKRNLVIPY